MERTVTTTLAGEPAADDAQLPRGLTVGRYVVLELVGRGGMGVVYSAYDFALERRVALKLFPSGFSRPDTHARLMREAATMAQLNHPSVVAVYDVGTFEERPYLVMELVEGRNLAEWLEERPRSTDAILEVFAQAADGLAAAHAAGIVHRDFKPRNVLVGEDGRARVADFGVAVEIDAASSAALQGTVPYMSPEQRRGEAVTPASDQFSFAVSLCEALTGTRPAPALDGAAPTIAGRPLPRRLRRVLERALASEAAKRFESMAALSAAVKDVRRRRVTTVATVSAVAVLLVASAGFAYWRGRAEGVSPCSGATSRLAQAWSAPAQQRLEKGLTSLSPELGPATWGGVKAEFDGWAGRWADAYQQACEDTRVRQVQSEQTLDQRMRCLDAQLVEAQDLALQLSSANDAVFERAVQAAQSLRRLGECRAADLHLVRWKTSAGTEASAQRLQAALSHVRVLQATGSNKEGFTAALALAAEAREAGDLFVLADALVLVGQLGPGDDPRALASLEESLLVSAQSGDEDSAIDARVTLARLQLNKGQVPQSRAHLDYARALLKRKGPDPERELKLRVIEARCAARDGNLDEAARVLKAAFDDGRQRLGPSDRAVLDAQLSLISTYEQLGRSDLALAELPDLLERQRALLGRYHPSLIIPLVLQSEASLVFGKLAEARQHIDEAAEAMTPTTFRHLELAAMVQLSNGNVCAAEGRAESAAEAFRKASDLGERGKSPLAVAMASGGLGELALRTGKTAEAVDWLGRSTAAFQEKFAAHPEFVRALALQGAALTAAGKFKDAEGALAQATARCQEHEASCGQRKGVVLTRSAELHLRQRQLAAAQTDAEEAVRTLDPRGETGLDGAEARLVLARVLAAQSLEPDRVRALAARALPIFAARKDCEPQRTEAASLAGTEAAPGQPRP